MKGDIVVPSSSSEPHRLPHHFLLCFLTACPNAPALRAFGRDEVGTLDLKPSVLCGIAFTSLVTLINLVVGVLSPACVSASERQNGVVELSVRGKNLILPRGSVFRS